MQLTLDGSRPPLPFTVLHTLDFSADSTAGDSSCFGELVASINAVVNGDGRTATAADLTRSPRLAGFGRSVAVGAASIGLVVLAAGLVVLGSSREIPTSVFGLASSAMFLVAVVAFAEMLKQVIVTYLASKQ